MEEKQRGIIINDNPIQFVGSELWHYCNMDYIADTNRKMIRFLTKCEPMWIFKIKFFEWLLLKGCVIWWSWKAKQFLNK